MDKISESYAQKILAEIKALKLLMTRPRGIPTEESEAQQYSSHNDKTPSQKESFREILSPDAGPAKSEKNRSKKNTAHQIRDFLDLNKPIIEVLGLFFLIAYTTVTTLQWRSSVDAVGAARDANRLNEESARARIGIEPKLVPLKLGEIVKVNFRIKNQGNSLASATEQHGFDRLIELPPGDKPVPLGTSHNSLLEPQGTEDTLIGFPREMTEEDLRRIPSLRDVLPTDTRNMSFQPRVPVMYVYGRISYETLGQQHEVDYCYFVARNTPALLTDNAPTKNDEFILVSCPKWNGIN